MFSSRHAPSQFAARLRNAVAGTTGDQMTRSERDRIERINLGIQSAQLSQRADALLKSLPREVSRSSVTPQGATSDHRAARRIASNMPALIWHGANSQYVSCLIRNRSATGAQLEFQNEGVAIELGEPGKSVPIKLTFGPPREQTTVDCRVMWIEDRRIGVRFCGQFQARTSSNARSRPVR